MPFQEIILQNLSIELKRDKNGKTYFFILDQNIDIAYFAFYGQVKSGWHDLETKWPKAKVVLIKLAEEKKVIKLKVLTKEDLKASKYDYLFNPMLHNNLT